MNKVFIDTNIIVYAQDRRCPEKQQQAIEHITELFNAGTGVVSTQVLQEYAATDLTKLGQKSEVVLHILYLLENFEVVRQTPGMIRKAVELKTLYSIRFWDACCSALTPGRMSVRQSVSFYKQVYRQCMQVLLKAKTVLISKCCRKRIKLLTYFKKALIVTLSYCSITIVQKKFFIR